MRIDLHRSSTVRSLAVAGVLIAATMLAPVVAGLGATDTITVCQDGTCDYAEIQPAVDAAQPGDEIVVQNEDDPYEGPVHIDTPRITLRGDDPWGFPVKVLDHGSTILSVEAGGVIVYGFHFVGADARVDHAQDVVLDSLWLTLARNGITIQQSSVTVANTYLHSDGITPDGTAITVEGAASSGFVLRGSTVGSFGDGIEIVDADNARIEDSHLFARGGQAIHLIGASDAVEGTRVIDSLLSPLGGTVMQIDHDGAEVRDTVLRGNSIQDNHERAIVVASNGDADWTADPVDARWNWWGEPVPSLENRGSVLVAPWCVHSSCVSAPSGL